MTAVRRRRGKGGGGEGKRKRPGRPGGRTWHDIERSKPHLIPTTAELDALADVAVETVKPRVGDATLGDFGIGVRIAGPERFDEALLVYPVDRATLAGVDIESVRLFRVDQQRRSFAAVWSSGINVRLGFLWSRVRRAGEYVAIGLPHDRLLQDALRRLAEERRGRGEDGDDLTEEFLAPFLEVPPEELEELRRLITRVELQTGVEGLSPVDLEMDTGGHPRAFLFPGRLTQSEFLKRIKRLSPAPGGLPEEQLFFPPHAPRNSEPPWNRPGSEPWEGIDWRTFDHLEIWKHYHHGVLEPILPGWLFNPNWWMYQHDIRHSGHASGLSDICESTVHNLYLHATVTVDGPVVTKPAIVNGKVYVGSGKQYGGGGTLYRIDLSSGGIENTLPTSGTAFYSWISGIGGSPAVTGNRVYFTGVHGTVYCINATTFAPVWSVSLKTADAAHNQPLNNPNADCWSGPLVVGNKVYVGCGEGESPTTYGFVFCLDAHTGNVIWCFCTCKFTAAAHNQPNHIPTAIAAPWAAAAGFTVRPNPTETGSSVWSSCAYDAVNNAIYVGTGNSQYPHTAQPDELYGSGLLALNADTGAFRGFFQPAPDDSYWPGDVDIDVPGSAAVYWMDGKRVVAFGSKNGSFFILDAATLAVAARRQLLPRAGGTGLPGDRGAAISSVVPTGGAGENSYGVFGTPAIDPTRRRIYVGLGGYNGMALDSAAGIDQTRTPFMRAVNWDDLRDAWPTALGADNVLRYTTTKPPMYSSREVGLTSPAVVWDVIFVSTSPPPYSNGNARMYALAASDGHCLWASGPLADGFALGPAIYGNFVVVGAGDRVYIYKLGPKWRFPVPPLYRKPWPWEIVRPVIDEPVLPDPPPGPWPGPEPTHFQKKR
jgi:outer membrane protein assembly factor BamB